MSDSNHLKVRVRSLFTYHGPHTHSLWTPFHKTKTNTWSLLCPG